MKKLVRVYLLVILFSTVGIVSGYAGFRMKPKPAAEATVATTTSGESTFIHKKTFSERKVPQLISAYKKMMFPHAAETKHAKTGWQGIASFVCGILGWALLGAYGLGLLFAIAAIIFGAIGANRRKHVNTGFALAGLILGALEIVVVVLLIALLAVIFL